MTATTGLTEDVDHPDFRAVVVDGWEEANRVVGAQLHTDGLPIVPPTPERVASMLDAAGLDAGTELGRIPERNRVLTAAQAAICAVMAGAEPEAFPVVVATWRAIFAPEFNAHAVLSSTGGAALTAVVSGPAAAAAGMHSGQGLLGPGHRANATIGRAVRLAAMTSLEAYPGGLDASSFGHAGKFSSHFAESEPPSPWSALHCRQGAQDATTVTVIAADAPRQVCQSNNRDPEGLLRTIAAAMKDPSHAGSGRDTNYMVVLGPEHAGILAGGGWTQPEVAQFLSDNSWITPEEFAAAGVLIGAGTMHFEPPQPDGRYRTARAEDIILVTAGGAGPGWTLVIPHWASGRPSHPATAVVEGKESRQ